MRIPTTLKVIAGLSFIAVAGSFMQDDDLRAAVQEAKRDCLSRGGIYKQQSRTEAVCILQNRRSTGAI